MPNRPHIFIKPHSGFSHFAYAGPETGMKDKVSYVIRQNKLTFVLTTPLRTENPVADHIYKHGDGVKVLALKVDDAAKSFVETTKRGAKAYLEPTVFLKDDDGEVVLEWHTCIRRHRTSFCRKEKITKVFSCRGLENGNRIITRRNELITC